MFQNFQIDPYNFFKNSSLTNEKIQNCKLAPKIFQFAPLIFYTLQIGL
jgi:hypothetical protein